MKLMHLLVPRSPLSIKAGGLLAAITFSVLAPLPMVAQTLTGPAAFTDYSKEEPGVRRKVTVEDLPAPDATPAANNGAVIAPRPDGVWPKTLPGFKVEQFATGLEEPRLMRMAPNGDIFVAESSARQDPGIPRHGKDGKADQMETFATGLKSALWYQFLSQRA